MANNVIAIGFFQRPGLDISSRPEIVARPSHDALWGEHRVGDGRSRHLAGGVGALAFPGPDLEPFGFTILITCLGVIAVRRALDDAQRLVAIDRELSIARQIQSSILPQSMPRVAGLTISTDDCRGWRRL